MLEAGASAYTTSFQGARYCALRYLRAASCLTVLALSSQSSVMPDRRAMFDRMQACEVRTVVSISEIGRWRVLTHSRKFSQCGSFIVNLAFSLSSKGCRVDFAAGIIL